jgi:hypothetical protein
MEPQNDNEQNVNNQDVPVGAPTEQVGQPAQINIAPSAVDPGKKLSIIGIVLAFLVPIAGIVVSIIAKNTSKKAGYNNKLAVRGLIVSIVFTVISLMVGILLMLSAINLFSGSFIVGNWKQTAAGLESTPITSNVGADFVEIKGDHSLTWYSDNSDKSKNYSTGTYTVEFGNKTNDNGQFSVGTDTLLYTLTFKVKEYVDGDGVKNNTTQDLVYLISRKSKEDNSFGAINGQTLRGYTFAKE